MGASSPSPHSEAYRMFFKTLTKIIEGSVLVLLGVIILFVTVEVFLRYLFGKTLIVTEELTRYLLVWLVFLAASLALKRDDHINIVVLVDRFRGKAKHIIVFISQTLLLTFLLFLFVTSILLLPNQVDQIAPSLGVSLLWFYLAMPIGCLLMMIFLIPKMFSTAKAVLKGQG